MNGLQHASAFVIQFRTDADAAGRATGRVEHVASGRTVLFQSVHELPALLTRMLKETSPTDRRRA